MTTPETPTRERRQDRGTIPVTVSAASAVAGTPLIAGPARLMGWSLQGGAGTLAAQGSVTSPGATTNIAITSALPVGVYQVTVHLSLAGTLTQGTDNDNMQVRVTGAGQVVRLNNTITAGEQVFGPFNLEITPLTGNQIAVQNIVAGTVGAIYTADVTVEQSAEGTITDGAQVVGVFAMPAGISDTRWLGDGGVYCGTDVQVHIAQGDVTGVIYVCKYHPEY